MRPAPDTTALEAAKILILDIETFPAHAEVDIYQQGKRWIGHKDITRPGGLLAWGAQWFHEPHTVRYRDMRHPDMLTDLWQMIDEAAYTVTFNGDSFDLRKIRGYFAREGLPSARPPKSIDLIKTARTLGFESASLDYTCRLLGVGRKLDNGGANNWRGCLAGDELAWREMRRYNVQDVRLTGDLFMALLPIAKMPVIGYPGDDAVHCPRCCSSDIHDVGAFQAERIRYRQHRCNNCTGLFRTTFHSRVSYSHAI